MTARRADERPDLSRRDMLGWTAVDYVAGSIARYVDHRKPHCHRGVFAAALSPCLRQVALQQTHVGYLVPYALAGLFRQLLAEVAQHLGRHHRTQRVQILPAPGSLQALQQAFELLVILWRDLDRLRRATHAATAAHRTGARRGAAGHDARSAGERG